MLNLAQSMFQKKDQSGEIAPVINFPKPSLIQEAIVDTRKEDGFTPLPNFICDEGYLAVLDGDALKCLVFLNRYVRGFHLDSKGMPETLIKKITGIKDGRTVQKYMSHLAKYQLIKIQKEKGKSNIYFLTFEDRLPTQHVGTLDVPTQKVPTSDVGSLPTHDVGSSTYMACGSYKEIYLKENIKENNNYKAPSEFVPQDRGALNFIDYHSDDPKLYTLKDLSGTYPIKKDFMAQAAVSFPKLSQAIVLEQLKELAQWSVGQPERISQKWMTTWLNWLRNYQPAKPKADKPKVAKKSNANLNVNDAWKDQATYHAPVENFQVDIPEDFV